MRFKKLSTHDQRLRADAAEEAGRTDTHPAQDAPIPLEWEPFEAEIRAERAERPTRAEAAEFVEALRPKLREQARREETLRFWNRRTARRRWTERLAFAAALVALGAAVLFQRVEIDRLGGRVANLEREVGALKAGF